MPSPLHWKKSLWILWGANFSVYVRHESRSGIVTSPWQLLSLRLLNGIFSGFISMAVSLQASVTPPEHSGKSLGTLQTGAIAGSLIGPLLGGLLAGFFGYSHVFFFSGGLMLC